MLASLFPMLASFRDVGDVGVTAILSVCTVGSLMSCHSVADVGETSTLFVAGTGSLPSSQDVDVMCLVGAGVSVPPASVDGAP